MNYKLGDLKKTYCNPLSLPDYPQGNYCRDKSIHGGWVTPEKIDFRETADPTVLYYKGKWYLYPSCGMAYYSEDFINWKHKKIEPEDIGYAPTVVENKGSFYLAACNSDLWKADNPLGPFKNIGPMMLPDGTLLNDSVYRWFDPMLFADEDGSLYAYSGSGKTGIMGAKLNPCQPNRLLHLPNRFFTYDSKREWERFGDYHEDKSVNWNEGAWMIKLGKKYYLTYAGPGTEWKTYGMGAYVSEHPLGPFKYMKTNPFLYDPNGLVHGPGHGCLVKGPNNTLWAFYTCLIRNIHNFERRVGVDAVGITKQGDLFTLGASEIPQWAPGLKKHPEEGNSLDLVPVSVNKLAIASSNEAGHIPFHAFDDTYHTFWQAKKGDKKPWLELSLGSFFDICAYRIQWSEPGLDYKRGIVPAPVKYKVLASIDGKKWKTVVNKSGNKVDMLIDYQVFKTVRAKYVKLVILKTAKGIAPAVLQMTVFGASK